MIESVQIRFVIVEGSKWQRLDGSVKTRSGTFTHRTPARQAEGAHHQVWRVGRTRSSFGLDSSKQDWINFCEHLRVEALLLG